jgi:hypothetical protein
MELKGYDFTRNPVVDNGVFFLEFEMCFMSLRSRNIILLNYSCDPQEDVTAKVQTYATGAIVG